MESMKYSAEPRRFAVSYAVKGYMEKEVNTINGEAVAREAAKVMVEKESGYLIILKEGSPVGILTESDFVKMVAQEIEPLTTKVSDIMTTPLITIDPDEDLMKASELMRKHNVKKLPVVRDGIIYGMITSGDIANKCGAYVDKAIKDVIRWTAPWGL